MKKQGLSSKLKHVVLLTLIVFTCCVTAYSKQESLRPSFLQQHDDGTWAYDRIIEAPNTTKDVLYDRLKRWILSNIASSDNNAVWDDKNHEMVITNPTLALGDLTHSDINGQVLNFKLTLRFKDNKVKVSANSFSYYGLINGPGGRSPLRGSLEEFKTYKSYVSQISNKIDDAFSRFIASIQKTMMSENKSDW